MPFRITCIALDGSQRAGRVQAMSIGRSAAFQSAQTATYLLLERQRRCHRQAKAPSGSSSCEGSGAYLHPRRPKKLRFVTTITQKTAVCDDHHLQKGGKERNSTQATSW